VDEDSLGGNLPSSIGLVIFLAVWRLQDLTKIIELIVLRFLENYNTNSSLWILSLDQKAPG
jgi:hypothetical protein